MQNSYIDVNVDLAIQCYAVDQKKKNKKHKRMQKKKTQALQQTITILSRRRTIKSYLKYKGNLRESVGRCGPSPAASRRVRRGGDRLKVQRLRGRRLRRLRGGGVGHFRFGPLRCRHRRRRGFAFAAGDRTEDGPSTWQERSAEQRRSTSVTAETLFGGVPVLSLVTHLSCANKSDKIIVYNTHNTYEMSACKT